MGVWYRHLDAMDGLRQLVAELSKIQDQFKSRGIVFIVHSMKLIHLINQNANPPRSALVRRYNDFTLGYTTGFRSVIPL
jgi:hypothetical protein